MLLLTEKPHKILIMRGRRQRDENLVKAFAKRFKELIGDMSLPKVSEKLDNIVTPVTLWDYVNGHSLPSPEVLMKISEKFDRTIDWLLKGDISDAAKNEQEKIYLYKYREAEKLMVTDKIDSYCNFIISETKKSASSKGIRKGKTVRYKTG